LIVSADIENQINALEKEERKNYMEMIGLNQTGLDSLIQKGYKILELDTYFTSGPEETRAWTIEKKLHCS
jgi:Predicted GTPase, probable translation factor